ncbi:MAG: hypothetical protein IPN86_11050 [Saprospiraceae bacterium]|nr:hypothetical protein [Saprospiraceae bacterium]
MSTPYRFCTVKITLLGLLCILSMTVLQGQEHSIARKWNELNLLSIENDYTLPTIQARNLHYITAAIYDAWAMYDLESKPYFLGKTVNGYYTPLDSTLKKTYNEADQKICISYAAYRMLKHRYKKAPKRAFIFPKYDSLMLSLGLDTAFVSIDYQNGDPRSLGNYISHHIIQYGINDGANELNNFKNSIYLPHNPPLKLDTSGTSGILDLNKWQPLAFNLFIDQGGNINPDNVPPFLSAEWGKVKPFALNQTSKVTLHRDTTSWDVYLDPGHPPYLKDTISSNLFDQYENFYKWGNVLVNNWSSHHNIEDTTLWNISPASLGNVLSYPRTHQDYLYFYNTNEGGDNGKGYPINPKTGLPYPSQWVKRADYSRVLAEFWADGPHSETPPGHWFTILNYVNDQPSLVRKFKGEGRLLDTLEWDIKAYFALGGAVHDAAISAWSVKGYYDYVRPISAIRGMAELGQSSDPLLPHYHQDGLPLIPGYIELITKTDPLVGQNLEYLWDLKIYSWRGYPYITQNNNNVAGVGWIRAKEWVPYQRATFVTPPFGGYISGHSTFSRAAAEVLTQFTGDPFFPGGMGEFKIVKDSSLIHEAGPTTDVTLQWAKYTDASDQCSLSRIWGGIHPPCDDIPGRIIGQQVGLQAIDYCLPYFFKDEDGDGYYSHTDCDDLNALIHPGHIELCDGLDNDCNGMIDDGLPLYTHYFDKDGDSFGGQDSVKVSCNANLLNNFANNNEDCDDDNSSIYPGATEIANNDVDEDCDGMDFLSNAVDTYLEKVHIYPNPSPGTFTVENTFNMELRYFLYQTDGTKIKTLDYSSDGQKHYVYDPVISAGLYILKIESITHHNVAKYIKIVFQ